MRSSLYATVALVAMVCATALWTTPARAQLTIEPSVDRNLLREGDPGAQIFISASNNGPAGLVDVYVAVSTPGGQLYSYTVGGWVPGAAPWASSISVPSIFSFPTTHIVTLPSLPAGSYTVYAGLARPSSLEFYALAQDLFIVAPQQAPAGNSSFGTVFLGEHTIYDPSAGVSSERTTGGAFTQTNLSLLEGFSLFEGEPPGLNACSFNKYPSNPLGLPNNVQFVTLDAGVKLRLDARQGGSDLGGIDLPLDGDLAALGQYFYAPAQGVELPVAVVNGTRDYIFSNGSGGTGVGPFIVELRGVDSLAVSSPDPRTLRSIDASSPLEIRWNGNSGRGEVQTSLFATNANLPFPDACSIQCRFVDNGAGSIASSLLVEFYQCANSGGGVIPGFPGFPGLPGLGATASLDVSRYDSKAFSAPGLDYGVAVVDSGVSVTGLSIECNAAQGCQ